MLNTMKLIVGLGNPGKEYELTRHNSGFRAIDLFADMAKLEIDREKFDGLYVKFKLDDEDVVLFKPTTYMNLSGKAVIQVVNFFKVNKEDIVVVYDDIALKVGDIRLRLKGSSGGQKGIQNIIDCLGTDEIKRIRIGIGEPEFDAIDYVLGKPKGEEADALEKGIKNAANAIKDYLFLDDFTKVMNKYNGGGAS